MAEHHTIMFFASIPLLILLWLSGCSPATFFETEDTYFSGHSGSVRPVKTVSLRAGRIIHAPDVPVAAGNEIAGLAFGEVRLGSCMTLSQIFLEGEIQTGDQLVLLTDAETIPVQLDILSSYNDGSTKQAILSFLLPPTNSRLTSAILAVAEPAVDSGTFSPC